MKKTLLKLFIGFVLLSGLAFSGLKLFKSSIFYLEKINYSYLENEDPALENAKAYKDFLKPQIEKKLKSAIGKSIWDIDIFALEKDLEGDLPWLKNVIISRQFPNELFIEVSFKNIVANIMKSPSKVQPVADDSTLLSEVEISKAPLAPVLSHNVFSTNDLLRKNALKLLRELPPVGTFSLDAVSEVYPVKNNRSDEFEVLLKKSKALVLINTENVPLKSARISKVIDYMDPQEMKGRVIDSNFSKKVLVRPRNHR